MLIVVVATEDGVSVTFGPDAEMQAEELLRNGWKALDVRPSNTDPNYWQHRFLVLRGEIVVPQAIETVTKWKF